MNEQMTNGYFDYVSNITQVSINYYGNNFQVIRFKK